MGLSWQWRGGSWSGAHGPLKVLIKDFGADRGGVWHYMSFLWDAGDAASQDSVY